MPYDELEKTAVCRHSGHKASQICSPDVDSVYIPRSGMSTPVCPYHRLVHLSPDGRFRVNSSCESPERMITRSWFVLPPSQEYYYRNYNIDYTPLPPFKPGCEQANSGQIDIIYPEHNAVLYLPKGFSGESEKFIFKAAHAGGEATIYWHLDDTYLGETRGEHKIECAASRGKHMLTLIDDRGNQRRIFFEVK